MDAKLPISAKKHELKGEKLYRRILVARDLVHVPGLCQRFVAHNFGRTWVHQSPRKEVYSRWKVSDTYIVCESPILIVLKALPLYR